MSDCLKQAVAAYKDILDQAEIEDVYKRLTRQKETAMRTGANIAQELTRAVADGVKNRERALKAKQLQDLKSMQAAVDNIQRIKAWQKRGITNPVLRALKAKIGGTAIKVVKGRESTELKMNRARTKFLRDFATDMDKTLAPLWNSKKYQVEIADALTKVHQGRAGEIENPSFRKIAEIVKTYQDRYVRGMREMGADIYELDDRIAPNVHSQGKIMQLTLEERRIIKASGQSNYAFLRDRWINFTLQNLDLERTFTKNNIDYRDKQAVTDFMRNVFDNIVNNGKVTQERMNILTKMTQSRVLHWKDASSLIAQNDRFGTGAIQDAITRELSFGFARLEQIKDWGAVPSVTVDRTLSILEKDSSLFERFDKAKEATKMKNLLNAMGRTSAEYAGTLGEFARNLRAFEFVTKLGGVTLKSIPDLGLLIREASLHGVPAYQAVGEAMRNLIFGMPTAEQAALKDLLDVGMQHQIGAVTKYSVEGYDASSVAQTAMRAAAKLNILEYWDHALRSTTDSIVSRRLAQMKNMSYDNLGKANQDSLALYNIDQADWDAIRQSSTTTVGAKQYITPDAVQQLPDSVLREALQQKGGSGRINDIRIRQYRDELENKLRDYFQDRQEHVILRPGVLDENLLTLNLGLPESDAGRQVLKLFTQFKLYSVAYARTPLASILFGNGATNYREALWGGKAAKMDMVKFIAYIMALKYASMSLDNLTQGLSPPSMSKPTTWLKMLAEGAGIYGVALNIDPNDPLSSLAKFAAGPGLNDVGKGITLGYNFINDSMQQAFSDEGGDYSKTLKSLDKLTKGFIPQYPWTAYIMNNLLMKEWEDYANPGARDKYLDSLQQKQGVTPIF